MNVVFHVVKEKNLTSMYLQSPLRTHRLSSRMKSCSRNVRSMTRVSVRPWASTVWGALRARDAFYGTNLCARANSPSVDLLAPHTATTTSPLLLPPPPPHIQPIAKLWRGWGWTRWRRERERWSADSWKTIKHRDVIVLRTFVGSVIQRDPGLFKVI